MILIKEQLGYCTKCNQVAILGNGLCVDCWSKQTDKMDDVKQCEKEVTPLDINILIFSDKCVNKIRAIRKPNGIQMICPECSTTIWVKQWRINKYPDRIFKCHNCRHKLIPKKVQTNGTICPRCDSNKIRKNGTYHEIQYYFCNSCKKCFRPTNLTNIDK